MVLITAPSAAAVEVYPPSTPGATVSDSVVAPGEPVVFSGQGFESGAEVAIAVNDVPLRSVEAADGTFTTTIIFSTAGTKVLTGTGPRGLADGAAYSPDSDVVITAAAYHPEEAAFVVQPAVGFDPVLTVQATVTVVIPGDGGDNGFVEASSRSGSLPFTGVETGALAASGLALVGAGLVLRLAARRRREPGTTSAGT